MLAGRVLKSTCHAQAEIVMQITSIQTLCERKFGWGAGGLAEPDKQPGHSLVIQMTAEASRLQLHCLRGNQLHSPNLLSAARFLHETPEFMPLTQDPGPLTGKARPRQQDRLLGDLPSSSTQPPQGAAGARLWSLLDKSTAFDASEAGRQRQQHEAYLQADIDQIQAQNQAIAAEQHAGGVSGMPFQEQPRRSHQEVEANFAAVVLKEREEIKKVQPAMEKMMLLRQRRVLQKKLCDVRILRFRLAQLPPDYYGGLHRQAL